MSQALTPLHNPHSDALVLLKVMQFIAGYTFGVDGRSPLATELGCLLLFRSVGWVTLGVDDLEDEGEAKWLLTEEGGRQLTGLLDDLQKWRRYVRPEVIA